MRRVHVVLLVFSVVLLGLTATPAFPAQQRVIRFGSGATLLEPYLMPQLLWGAEYLAQQGVRFEYTNFSTDEAIEAALDGNRIDLGLLSVLGANRSIAQGLRERFIIGNENHDISVLVVQSGVKDIKQLKGKRIGVQSRTSLSTVAAEYLLRQRAGFTAGKDYSLVYMPGSTTRAAGLEKGVLDAAQIFAPIAAQLLERTGNRFRIVGGLFDVMPPLLWEGVAASDQFRTGNRDLAKLFIKADLYAIKKFYATPAAVAATEFRSRLKGADAYTLKSLTTVMEMFHRIKLWPTDGDLQKASYDSMNKFLVEQHQITPDKVVPYERAVDRSLLDEVLAGK